MCLCASSICRPEWTKRPWLQLVRGLKDSSRSIVNPGSPISSEDSRRNSGNANCWKLCKHRLVHLSRSASRHYLKPLFFFNQHFADSHFVERSFLYTMVISKIMYAKYFIVKAASAPRPFMLQSKGYNRVTCCNYNCAIIVIRYQRCKWLVQVKRRRGRVVRKVRCREV